MLISVAASGGAMSSATRMHLAQAARPARAGAALFFRLAIRRLSTSEMSLLFGLEGEVGDGAEDVQVFVLDLLDGPFGLDQPALDGAAGSRPAGGCP
ncbi:MAG: hypothetical protein MZV63_33595 [Marinilabiliales bacterium]|nr:hypothetical protein [Marinilabiliales bacterium]